MDSSWTVKVILWVLTYFISSAWNYEATLLKCQTRLQSFLRHCLQWPFSCSRSAICLLRNLVFRRSRNFKTNVPVIFRQVLLYGYGPLLVRNDNNPYRSPMPTGYCYYGINVIQINSIISITCAHFLVLLSTKFATYEIRYT